MAGRKPRYDAEYFPFKIKEGKTFTILQQKFGNAGMGFFTNLMRLLTRTPHHFIMILDEVDEMYFWAQCGTDSEKGKPVMDLLLKTGKIDKQLWNMKIVCCPDLIDSLEPLYQKRTNPISKPSHIKNWANKFDFSGKSGSEIEFPALEIHKVKKSKVSKEKESISAHRNRIFEFFYFKNYRSPKSEADRFVAHYTKTGGKDKNGNPVDDYLAAAKFWKPKEMGAHTQPDLLLKWKKGFDAYYANSPIDDDEDPLLLNVFVASCDSLNVTFKTSKVMEWKIRNHAAENFKKAVFEAFGKVNINFSSY